MRIKALCRLFGPALLTIVIAAGASARVVAAEPVDELFNDRIVQEVRLAINERDLRELRDRYVENVYFPADFQWRESASAKRWRAIPRARQSQRDEAGVED
jgi:hypothetical protein